MVVAVLAVLTVIGGLDTRPCLGGFVQHDELGTGTITKVESKSHYSNFSGSSYREPHLGGRPLSWTKDCQNVPTQQYQVCKL